MKNERSFPAFTVSPKAERALRAGHPWVYAEEIRNAPEKWDNGALADVFSEKGAYLGTGLLSEKSKIRIRILAQNANERFEDAFFRRRVSYALAYRRNVMGGEDYLCCRLIFGEADGLPGVTVDRFGDILVAQISSYGMEQRKEMLYSALCDCLYREDGVRVAGIFERNEAALRELEGLPREKGWYSRLPHPEKTVFEITENGVRYDIDVKNGQKTGFFLDQKYNRLAAGKLAAGHKVLDCFTHTGSFALNCARLGAAHVTAVDVSADAITLARANAQKNGLEDRIDFVCADVFELLPRLCEEHADFDFVILDPPAFTKSRRTARDAERGYKEINYRAMRLLPRGGFLATCSCSHFMESERFLPMLESAARDAGVRLKLIEARRQAPDHPMLLGVPETDYLKFYLFQVV